MSIGTPWGGENMVRLIGLLVGLGFRLFGVVVRILYCFGLVHVIVGVTVPFALVELIHPQFFYSTPLVFGVVEYFAMFVGLVFVFLGFFTLGKNILRQAKKIKKTVVNRKQQREILQLIAEDKRQREIIKSLTTEGKNEY